MARRGGSRKGGGSGYHSRTMRYAAFLRGVMPTNCKMPALKAAFEAAGFTDVATLLGSGNVTFSARTATEAALERKAEAAMRQELGRAFMTIVRSVDDLRALLALDPYRGAPISPTAKRVVTFLREMPAKRALPKEVHGARIVAVRGREVFSAYERTSKGPVFMTLIEKTFGADQTTRTWQTVEKVAR